MTAYQTGDRVRIKDGRLDWVARRDGWVLVGADGKLYLDAPGGIRIGPIRDIHVEPESPQAPQVPAEPDAPAVLLTWGAPLHTEITMARTWDGRWAMPSSGLTYTWKNVPQLDTATATPLYPIPDPDDDEAVEALLDRFNDPLLRYTSTVRSVLRALRTKEKS